MGRLGGSISLLAYPTRRRADRLTHRHLRRLTNWQIVYLTQRLVDDLTYLIYAAPPNDTG